MDELQVTNDVRIQIKGRSIVFKVYVPDVGYQPYLNIQDYSGNWWTQNMNGATMHTDYTKAIKDAVVYTHKNKKYILSTLVTRYQDELNKKAAENKLEQDLRSSVLDAFKE